MLGAEFNKSTSVFNHPDVSPAGQANFTFLSFYILKFFCHILHPNPHFLSLLSFLPSTSPFPQSTPPFLFWKWQASQPYQRSMVHKVSIRPETTLHINARRGKRVGRKRSQKADKGTVPTSNIRSPTRTLSCRTVTHAEEFARPHAASLNFISVSVSSSEPG